MLSYHRIGELSYRQAVVLIAFCKTTFYKTVILSSNSLYCYMDLFLCNLSPTASEVSELLRSPSDSAICSTNQDYYTNLISLCKNVLYCRAATNANLVLKNPDLCSVKCRSVSFCRKTI
jgi:hypothetical protein